MEHAAHLALLLQEEQPRGVKQASAAPGAGRGPERHFLGTNVWRGPRSYIQVESPGRTGSAGARNSSCRTGERVGSAAPLLAAENPLFPQPQPLPLPIPFVQLSFIFCAPVFTALAYA